jgi:hypothetical protein
MLHLGLTVTRRAGVLDYLIDLDNFIRPLQKRKMLSCAILVDVRTGKDKWVGMEFVHIFSTMGMLNKQTS